MRPMGFNVHSMGFQERYRRIPESFIVSGVFQEVSEAFKGVSGVFQDVRRAFERILGSSGDYRGVPVSFRFCRSLSWGRRGFQVRSKRVSGILRAFQAIYLRNRLNPRNA